MAPEPGHLIFITEIWHYIIYRVSCHRTEALHAIHCRLPVVYGWSLKVDSSVSRCRDPCGRGTARAYACVCHGGEHSLDAALIICLQVTCREVA